jgi:tetratricopeptide (TPR) repeat protein
MTDTQSEDRALEHIRLLCELRRFDEAAALARRATAIAPGEVDGWCLLAQALLGLDDDDGALEAARRAAALAPEFEWPHRLQSIALAALGRRQESLHAAIESARCDPFAWQTHGRVGGASAALGLHEQAEAAVSRALELGPNESRAWVTAGGVATSKGDRGLGAQRYRRALELDPQDADAHAGLATTQLGRSKYAHPSGLAAAASGFATAVRTDPSEHSNRTAIDVVLRVFLARAALFIYVACYLTFRWSSHSSSDVARLAPVVVLAGPLIFGWAFVTKLDRDVRRHLLRTLRHRLIAIAAVVDLSAVVAIVVGAFLPQHARPVAGIAALICGLTARLVLYMERRRKLPDLAEPLARWRSLAITVAVGFGAAGALMIYGGLSGLGSLTVTTAGVISVAIGIALAVAFGRRR